MFTFVYGKVGLTPRLFLAWYTEFRLCFLLLRSSQTAKASEDSTGVGPASLPPTLQLLHQWEAPERVLGGVYGRLSAKKREMGLVFFDGRHVHPPLPFRAD